MAANAWVALAIVLATLLGTHAGDPDITSDFVVPDGVTPDANFFTFKGLKQALWGAPMDPPVKVTKASQVEFPALMGLCLGGSGIDKDALAKSFKTDAQTIDKLVSANTMG
ncbi:hypothetical protein COCNU_07G001650 [Cocos nucifera]|uniref:Uncharacterized protein n=1 Tax=Cocos nucifera TaxID=13894 RepID=A0A8K0IDY2_COCNU|nr:hypothetical protein COCNU_07G001650 [Cocos nucifera]